ncbi:hypothetical protein [Bradyrhizobium sp. SZCCHNS3052]|uniref:hypothetical protein n=1 Tax=Bradyrhizobium sp. SZCCHNS3052 TaxID=3057321 RepID=UPI003967D381
MPWKAKHAPSIGEFDGHHTLRWTHEIAQGVRDGPVIRQQGTSELGALPLGDSELRAPAEQQPGDDPVLARDGRDLGAWQLGFFAIASSSSSLNMRRAGARGRCRIADVVDCQAAFGL